MNSVIKEILTYHDTIAASVTEYGDSSYSIESFESDHGRWLYLGNDPQNSLAECRQHFKTWAEEMLIQARNSELIAVIPHDTSSFVTFLEKHAGNPKDFVLQKCEEKKIVMYGETHFRKASWDFCTELIHDKRLATHVGVVFMEMASDKQADIDRFMANDTLDRELLLNIFRDYIITGWNDKGKFDFIISLRDLNRNLPADKRIRLIAVDTPRPFSTFHSREDMEKSDARFDRNEFMANTILAYLDSCVDKRNSLFIVGTGHLLRSEKSAGSILSSKLKAGKTYTFFTHTPVIAEGMDVPLRIRHGMFDYAFFKNGDTPVAFDLLNSPFGDEPFDASFETGSGKFRDNYDGYIFLGPLDQEPNGELLPDLFSDRYINEINRRFSFYGTTLQEEWGLKDVTTKGINEFLLKDHTKGRWENYLPPLKNGKTVLTAN